MTILSSNRWLVLLLVASAILVSGCGSDRAPPVISTSLDLADKSMLNVDATSLDVRVDLSPSREYPHVGYMAPLPFDRAVSEWARDHFRLNGDSVNTLRVTLLADDITEKILPVRHGISAWFRRQNGAEYSASLRLRVELVSPNGRVLYSTEGSAFDRRISPEEATQDDKLATWSSMVDSAFDALDQEILPQIRGAMSGFVH